MSHGVLKGDHEVTWLPNTELREDDIVILGDNCVRRLAEDRGIHCGYRVFAITRLAGDCPLGEFQFLPSSGTLVLRKVEVQTDLRQRLAAGEPKGLLQKRLAAR